jgi:hypothetical protein
VDSEQERTYGVSRPSGAPAFTLGDLEAFVRSAQKAGLAPSARVYGAISPNSDPVYLVKLAVRETPGDRKAFWSLPENAQPSYIAGPIGPSTNAPSTMDLQPPLQIVGAMDFDPSEVGEVRGEVTEDDPVFGSHITPRRRKPAPVQDGTAVDEVDDNELTYDRETGRPHHFSEKEE